MDACGFLGRTLLEVKHAGAGSTPLVRGCAVGHDSHNHVPEGGELVRRRQTWWLVVAVVAAGCAAPGSNSPAISDETDVWFMRHMAGHLLQTTAILDLSSDRITRPRLPGSPTS